MIGVAYRHDIACEAVESIVVVASEGVMAGGVSGQGACLKKCVRSCAHDGAHSYSRRGSEEDRMRGRQAYAALGSGAQP